MRSTETLEHEHDVILKVLEAAEHEAEFIRREHKLRPERINKLVDFFNNFTYRCHHAKEEHHLFPFLRNHLPETMKELLDELLDEHERGHDLIQGIADASEHYESGDVEKLDIISDNLARYVELIDEHIDKENNRLFPEGRTVINKSQATTLADEFERVEAEEMGEGVHEQYHQLAHELAGE